MQLEGSCHCGAVSFSLTSAHPYPYQRCYCSICRKTQGGGGLCDQYRLVMPAASKCARPQEHQRFTMRLLKGEGEQRAHRSSCRAAFLLAVCGSGLWLFSPEWPELIHPFASAVDTRATDTAGAHALDAQFQGTLGRGRSRA
jgi:hypothetical protein